MRWLFLALLIVPAMEIGIFVWAGGIIGPWWVAVLILLTGFAGITIARRQGMNTWLKAREAISSGRMPAIEIVDGICIFIGSVFLFTPGFITDTVGFFLVLPWTRKPFRYLLGYLIQRKMKNGTIVFRKF